MLKKLWLKNRFIFLDIGITLIAKAIRNIFGLDLSTLRKMHLLVENLFLNMVNLKHSMIGLVVASKLLLEQKILERKLKQ